MQLPANGRNTEQTALVGPAMHEVNCLAVENNEYRRLADERMRKLFQPKHTTTFLQPDQHNEARLLHNSQKTKLEKFIVSREANDTRFALLLIVFKGACCSEAKETAGEQERPHPATGAHTMADQSFLGLQILAT